ncbi:hypothetical protein K440DRAFT_634498 [Wilcoxina mikolae CBS 423.85]|nr:hypothetical protein K440DRAFT_634498 [Wilcoxina mikolae CBS 423.85]
MNREWRDYHDEECAGGSEYPAIRPQQDSTDYHTEAFMFPLTGTHGQLGDHFSAGSSFSTSSMPSSQSQSQSLLSPDYTPYPLSSFAASASSSRHHVSTSSQNSAHRASASPYHSYPSSPSNYPPPHSPYPSSSQPSPYATSPHDSPSPFADLTEPQIDPDIITCFFPPLGPTPSNTPANSAPVAPLSFPCDHPSCTKSYPRQCDLRKHKKRHQKPFPCRASTECNSYFSTEKDRDRHERSKHRREEHLVCSVCGHRTARKDNMKDHVRRRHGEERVEEVLAAVMIGE